MLISLLTLSIPVIFSSENHVYSKIEKAYTKDQQKGIALADRYIKRNAKIASPYYFKLNHAMDYVENSTNSLLNRATNLSYAITYGVKFEQLADDALETKLNWNAKKVEIEEATQAFLVHLTAKNPSKARLISQKMKKLNSDFKNASVTAMKEPDFVATKTVEKARPIETTLFSPSAEINFNVNPTGRENIPAASKEKEEQFLALLNAKRKEKGLPLLKMDKDLCRAARYHASDMAKQNYFNHNTHNVKANKISDELGTFERIALFRPHGGAINENIAAGSETAQGTYQQWFTSPGHHQNMFANLTNCAGIGYYYDANSTYKHYWVFCSTRE